MVVEVAGELGHGTAGRRRTAALRHVPVSSLQCSRDLRHGSRREPNLVGLVAPEFGGEPLKVAIQMDRTGQGT
jgi:hypothetical protein